MNNDEPMAVVKVTFDEFYYRNVIYVFIVLIDILLSLYVINSIWHTVERIRGRGYDDILHVEPVVSSGSGSGSGGSGQRRFYHPFFN